LILLLGLLGICPGIPGGLHAGPPELLPETTREPDSGQEDGTNLGAWLATLFRDHISEVDGDRCPSLPSCSAYSVEVFKKHGFFIGWVMTVDRLIHEADEDSVSPLVYHYGKVKILDPVENNDFWWFPQERERP